MNQILIGQFEFRGQKHYVQYKIIKLKLKFMTAYSKCEKDYISQPFLLSLSEENGKQMKCHLFDIKTRFIKYYITKIQL